MLLVEPPSASRTREGGKNEGETTTQRKGTRSEKLARNVGGRETFDLLIVDESKGKRVRPSSSRSLLASEWGNGLVVECVGVAGGLTG